MRFFPIVVVGLSLLGVVVFLLARQSPVGSKADAATAQPLHGEREPASTARADLEAPLAEPAQVSAPAAGERVATDGPTTRSGADGTAPGSNPSSAPEPGGNAVVPDPPPTMALFQQRAREVAKDLMERGVYEFVPFDFVNGNDPEELFVLQSIDESTQPPRLKRVVLRSGQYPELADLRDRALPATRRKR